MKKLIISVALAILTGCAASKKTVTDMDDSTLSAHAIRKIAVDDSVWLSRLTDLTVIHPRMIISRRAPLDTTVVFIEAERFIARDSTAYNGKITAAITDTNSVTAVAIRESHTESRPEFFGRLLYVALALLAGFFIGLSFRGIDSRR